MDKGVRRGLGSFQMRSRLFAVTSALCACAITSNASADFTHAHIENLGDIGGGANTYRVYVNFDNPLDQLLAIATMPGLAPFAFSATTPLINAGGKLSGSPAEDLPQSPISEPWDSWVTIKAETAEETDLYIGSFNPIDDYTEAFIVGDSWEVENTGIFASPGEPLQCPTVLIAQFTLEGDFTLTGVVAWVPAGGGPGFVSTPFEVSTFCTGDIDGDDVIGFSDLITILTEWGPCPPGGPCPADLDDDGSVGLSDLLFVLAGWGPCF